MTIVKHYINNRWKWDVDLSEHRRRSVNHV